MDLFAVASFHQTINVLQMALALGLSMMKTYNFFQAASTLLTRYSLEGRYGEDDQEKM
jgi:hypothetical protein